MELIEAFEQGKVEGTETIVNTIDTAISKVFIGKHKVYKVYHKENSFFGNLGDPAYRKEFYNQDFSWNQIMSPHVYLKLHPVKFKGSKFVAVPDKEAEDYFIEMMLVDTTATVSHLLLSEKLSSENVKKIAKAFNERIKKLNKEKLNELSSIKKSWYELWEKRLDDLEKFSLEQSLIKSDLLKRAINALRKQLKESNYFKDYQHSKLSVGIDGHSDNVILSNDQINFLDIFLVRENWRLIDPHFDICRIAADIDALGQSELVPVLYENSSHNPYDIPKEVRISYELVSATIKGIYNVIIGKENLAKMYIPLIDKLTKELEK